MQLFKKHLLIGAMILVFSPLMIAEEEVVLTATLTSLAETARDGATFNGMSANGLWACGAAYSAADYEGYNVNASIWDLTTGQRTILADRTEGQSDAISISEDGTFVVGSRLQQPAYYSNGSWKKLPIPQSYTLGDATCFAITEKGDTLIGGFVWSTATRGVACLWLNGQLIDVEYPTDKDRRGDIIEMATISDISSDGKMMTLTIDFNLPLESLAFLIKEDTVIQLDREIPGYLSLYSSVEGAHFGANDKYIVGSYYLVEDGETEYTPEYVQTYIYDIEKDTLSLIPNASFMAGTQVGGMDEYGNLYLNQSTGTPLRVPWIYKNKTYIRLEDALVEYDGIEKKDLENLSKDWNQDGIGEGMGTLMGVSADGRVMIGSGDFSAGSLWVIHLSHNIYKYGTVVKNQPVIADKDKVEAYYADDAIHFTAEVHSVQIFDISGRMVLNRQVSNNEIATPNLTDGIYIVRVFDQTNNCLGISKIAVQ